MKRDNLIIAESKVQLARSLIAEAKTLSGEILTKIMREDIIAAQLNMEDWEFFLRNEADKMEGKDA